MGKRHDYEKKEKDFGNKGKLTTLINKPIYLAITQFVEKK